jgi:hypothetical protein
MEDSISIPDKDFDDLPDLVASKWKAANQRIPEINLEGILFR